MKTLRKTATVVSQVIGLVAGRKFDTPATETLKHYPTIQYGI